jgi:hypothetical protein
MGFASKPSDAFPHSAKAMPDTTENPGFEIIPHPLYSIDLALSDFHMSGAPKRNVARLALHTEEVEQAVCL